MSTKTEVINAMGAALADGICCQMFDDDGICCMASNALEALRAAAAMGWEMKPCEPTAEMLEKGHHSLALAFSNDPRGVYMEMFAVGPSLLDDTGPA